MDIKAVAVYDSSSSLKRLIWNNITKKNQTFSMQEQQPLEEFSGFDSKANENQVNTRRNFVQ
jgi:hypothetical protein